MEDMDMIPTLLLVCAAFASVVAAIAAFRAEQFAKKTASMAKQIEVNTDGMRDALVKATDLAAFARGLDAGEAASARRKT
jgi:hypothetical protein